MDESFYIDILGDRMWIANGIGLHREDGPAVIWADGSAAWYISNKVYSFAEYCEKLKLTPAQILELRLKYL